MTAACLWGLPAVRTHLCIFDTEVVDLTESVTDPVEVLMKIQLGGGTDINRALAYCQGTITQPADTVLVLISDLYEGGIAEEMLRRARQVVDSGATMVALLALSDSGAPSYDADHAAALASVGVPAFACTPDLFPDLMAAAIERRDIGAWAASSPRLRKASTRMCSTCEATSLIRLANVPVVWVTGESRTRMRNPSVEDSM